jgi:hypothetical protein
MTRRDLRLLFGLAGLAVAWALVQAATGYDGGFAFMAPACFVAVPLLAGRYLGEEQLTRLARRARTRRAPRRAPRVDGRARAPRRLLSRGGALIARSLAVRPPPSRLAAH